MYASINKSASDKLQWIRHRSQHLPPDHERRTFIGWPAVYLMSLVDVTGTYNTLRHWHPPLPPPPRSAPRHLRAWEAGQRFCEPGRFYEGGEEGRGGVGPQNSGSN